MLFPISRNLLFKTASCERIKLSHKNRISSVQKHILRKKEATFSWTLFWEFVKPDIILFIFATVAAFGVAIINIKLPLLLGELVNSISLLIRDAQRNADVFSTLYNPCKKLVWNYILQSLLTVAYITALSSFGERLATRMRIKLFKSLMEQDTAFFDVHKTGEIINRYVAIFLYLMKHVFNIKEMSCCGI